MAKHTPLYKQHLLHNATLMDFAGWEMPLHYGSQIAEHSQVRSDAGMFDVSHMGIIDITGSGVQEFLAKMLANDIAKLQRPGKALYSCILNNAGGVLDDLIVYYIAPDYYRLVVNAACVDKDFSWLQQHSPGYTISLVLRTDLAIIALQGPTAIVKFAAALDAAGAEAVQSLGKFDCIEYADLFIARTGYTGEDGVEVILPATHAENFWQDMMQQAIKPIGLGARDTLRLEAGLNLYGVDMDVSVTPYEANLAWTVALKPESRDFIGRSALQTQKNLGMAKHLTPLVLTDRGVLRHGQKVYSNDAEVGYITSGTFSPTLQRAIALAYINTTDLQPNYSVEIREKQHLAQVVKLPFVKNGKANFILN